MDMKHLDYISTDTVGYKRKKWGRGFTYLDTKGKTINDLKLRQWIESIAIPPAWTDVWICPNKNGHILAMGRDDKGRKQYCYHPKWHEMRNQKKFDDLLDFGKNLPLIRANTDEHLRQHKVSRERVLATVVRLLETTLIRIGNDEYAKNNNSYGLTTLTDDHATINGNKIIFDFVGKSGQEHTIELRDRRLARIVQHCQDIPGYELFQYYDEEGINQTLSSGDINDYLYEITGKSFTAKVFRTWGGSVLAIKHLCEECHNLPPKTGIQVCVDHVAQALGNTKAVCRQYYIHPIILDAYSDGKLAKIYKSKQKKSSSKFDLSPEELTLMKLIAESDL